MLHLERLAVYTGGIGGKKISSHVVNPRQQRLKTPNAPSFFSFDVCKKQRPWKEATSAKSRGCVPIIKEQRWLTTLPVQGVYAGRVEAAQLSLLPQIDQVVCDQLQHLVSLSSSADCKLWCGIREVNRTQQT